MSGGYLGAPFDVSSVSIFGNYGASTIGTDFVVTVSSSGGGGAAEIVGYALYRTFPATDRTFPILTQRSFPRA